MRSFSSELTTELVEIDGKMYEIRELTTAGRERYLDALGKSLQIKVAGTGETDGQGAEKMRQEIVIGDLRGAHVELLSATMFVVDGEDRKPVPASRIRAWGARLTEQLAAIAAELNELSVPEKQLQEDAEKN